MIKLRNTLILIPKYPFYNYNIHPLVIIKELYTI